MTGLLKNTEAQHVVMWAAWLVHSDNVYVSMTDNVFLYRCHGYAKVFLEQDPLLYVRFLFHISVLLLFCFRGAVSLICQSDKLFGHAWISPGILEGIKPLSPLLYNHSFVSLFAAPLPTLFTHLPYCSHSPPRNLPGHSSHSNI